MKNTEWKFSEKYEGVFNKVKYSKNIKCQNEVLNRLRMAAKIEAELYCNISAEASEIVNALRILADSNFKKPTRETFSSISRNVSRIATLYFKTSRDLYQNKLFSEYLSQEQFENYLCWSLVWFEDGITFVKPKEHKPSKFDKLQLWMKKNGFERDVVKNLARSFSDLERNITEYNDAYNAFMNSEGTEYATSNLRELFHGTYLILGWINRWGALLTYLIEVENSALKWQ